MRENRSAIEARQVGLVFSLMRCENYNLYSRYRHITPEFLETFIPDFLEFKVDYVDGHNNPAASRLRDVVWYGKSNRVGYLRYTFDIEDSAWTKKHYMKPTRDKPKEWLFYRPSEADFEGEWEHRFHELYDTCNNVVSSCSTVKGVLESEFSLEAFCSTCMETRPLDIGVLSRTSNASTSIEILSKRSRCTTCGKKGNYVTVTR